MRRERYSDLADAILPFIIEAVSGGASSATAAAQGGVPDDIATIEASLAAHIADAAVHHTITELDGRYVQLGNADMHPRLHDILSAADHEITAPAGVLLGTTAVDTLGTITPTSDGTSGGKILRTDSGGSITVTNLTATNAVYGDTLEASIRVRTPRIEAAANLVIDPTAHLDLTPGEDLRLRPDGHILFDRLIASDQATGGNSNISLNPDTGLIDALSIQANEAYFNAVIAEARWAEAGEIELTPSVAPLTRPFVIPAVGAEGTMYVSYLEGLPGYNPLGDGHLAKVKFFQDGGVVQQPVTWVGRAYSQDEGVASGGGTIQAYYDTNFSDFDPGGHGVDLIHTASGNSMAEAANNAQVYDDSGNKVLRIETNATNCHTHFDGNNATTLEDYEFTGRFKVAATTIGFGLTLYSDYPNTDTYYRIRRYNTVGKKEFYVENHGDGSWDMQGTTVSAYDPTDNLNVWHRFRIQIGAGLDGTEIKARFWLDGSTEPSAWDIDCYDANSFRTQGTFGFWYMNGGPNNIMIDDLNVSSLAATGGSTIPSSVFSLIPNGTQDGDELVALVSYPTAGTLTVPSGWTLRQTRSTTTPDVTTKMFNYTWNTGDPTFFIWDLDTSGALLVSTVALRYVRTTGTRLTSASAAGNGTSLLSPANLVVKDNGLAFYALIRHDGFPATTTSIPSGFVSAGIQSNGDYIHSFYYSTVSEDDAAFAPSFGGQLNTGDYVWMEICLNPEDGQDLPFYVGAAWGIVAPADPQPGDVTAEEVAYTWTTQGSYKSADGSMVNAVGKTAQIDARVQDYGDPAGDVYMLLTVLDKKGPPYIRLARHNGYNAEKNQLDSEIIGQFGQLSGLAGAIPEIDAADEPGLIVRKENGRKVLLSPNQFILEGADSTWYDHDGQKLFTVTDEAGAVVHTKTDETEYVLQEGQRGYSFANTSGTLVASVAYASIYPSNPILPRQSRLRSMIHTSARDGVENILVASNTDSGKKAMIGLYGQTGGNTAYMELAQNGSAAAMTTNAKVGIGTTDPDAYLHLAAASAEGTRHIKLDGAATTEKGYLGNYASSLFLASGAYYDTSSWVPDDGGTIPVVLQLSGDGGYMNFRVGDTVGSGNSTTRMWLEKASARVMTTGGMIIAPGDSTSNIDSAYYVSHSLLQAHKSVGGFGAWTIQGLSAETSFVASSQSTSVDRRIAGTAVVYNTNDGTVTEWDFATNKGSTTSKVVGDSTITIGVSGTGRAYIKRTNGTSDFDVTWHASWL